MTKLVVLAAGVGSRLAPVTYYCPKALLPFGGKTLTEHLVQAFVDAGVDSIVMCVGYKADKVAVELGMSLCGVPVEYSFNPQYNCTGAGYSLKLAEHLWVGTDCVIVEGDQLIHPNIAKKLMYASWDCILVDSSITPELGEETVIVGKNNKVSQIVWPASSIQPHLIPSIVGEAIVMAYLSDISSWELSKQLGTGEVIDAFNHVVTNYEDVAGLPWIEIDTPEDLRCADEIYKVITGES